MKIYTSYFSNIRNLPKKITFFSIAGKTPMWYLEANKKNYFQYKKLAPKYQWWNEWHNKFIDDLNSEDSIKWYTEKYYETVLNKLEAEYVVHDLENISKKNDVCLLCYETPEKFCHRILVVEWLKENGFDAEEFKKV